ncbi:MAG: hypothetical protein MUF14_00340 [Hyphomonadaceae bacterium]|jgi:hypothetical protein|nr:hypothetical protein [Hyphomonadaceae bacterium]
MPAVIGGIALVFASCCAGTAGAQLSGRPQTLDFEVTGLVATSCAATSGDIGAQITQALAGARPGDTRQVGFSLDCNKPFRVRVQSANGGLTLAGMSAQDRAAAVRDGLQPVLDYAVGIDLPYRALTGADDRLVSVCQSAAALVLNAPATAECALGGPDGVVVPGLSLDQPGSFQINLAMPDRPLVAGRLSDTIVIVIEAVR